MKIKVDPNLIRKPVEDTGFSVGWIIGILTGHDLRFRNAVHGGVITGITARDISKNKGYASKIYKTCIFINNSPKSVYNFVMKIPTIECIHTVTDQIFIDGEQNEMLIMKEGKMMEKLAFFHNIECDFYNIFKNFDGLPMPRVTYIQKAYPLEKQIGVIFMEDLSETMQTLGIFGSLNVFQIKAIVKHLAVFHAHLFANEEKWKGKFGDSHFVDAEMIDMIKNFNQKVVKEHEDFIPLLEKLDYVTFDEKIIQYLINGCCGDIGLPKLVCLGDLWTNNVLWRKREEETPNEVLAFVDFQIAFEGNLMFDAARVITICADPDIRRDVEYFIFDYYFEILTNQLHKYNMKPEFTVDQLKKAYDYAMINQTSWCPMMMVFFSSNQEVSKEIHEARMAKLKMRAKMGLKDAIERVETLHPDWIRTRGA